MGGYHYWKGGDDDPRDQVGVDPTTPAVSGPTAGPPDLDHAIQAATLALGDRVWKMGAYDAARIAVEAAAPVLLQATRDRLADLEVYAAEAVVNVKDARAKIRLLLDTSGFKPSSVAQTMRQAHTALDVAAGALAAFDGPAAQEEDDQACDACGGLFTHDPQCGYLADSYRDGTEGRQ